MAKRESTGPDPQTIEIEWQGIKLKVERDSPEFRKLQNLAESQIENEFLEERIKLLESVKTLIREKFTADDYTALNGFGFYMKFNAQRMTDNGMVKSTALKIYARVPKSKADDIVITDANEPDNEPEVEGSG